MILNNALIKGELKSVEIKDGKITKISDTALSGGFDIGGRRLIPGLIDIHTHGCLGVDTMDADFAPMCRFYAEHGTTSFMPTAMTMGYDDLLRVCEAPTEHEGANIIGLHFEGPFISTKYKGAQNEKYLKPASVEDFHQFKGVKLINVAPEVEGCMDFIREVTPDCVVSIGHTDCDYDTAIAAIENGANCLTHTFNAMPPMHHRNPGPIGAAVEKHIYAQIIGDLLHVHSSVLLAAYKMFGKNRLILISDSLRCTGLPDGQYESGGLDIVLKDGIARLLDGTIAGSIATLWDCVKNVTSIGIPFDEAVDMASRNPAQMLGLNKGKIELGYDADLLIINNDMEIETVIIGGEIFKKQ